MLTISRVVFCYSPLIFNKSQPRLLLVFEFLMELYALVYIVSAYSICQSVKAMPTINFPSYECFHCS